MARSLEGLLLLNLVFLLVGLAIVWAVRGWRAWSDFAALLGVAYMSGLASVTLVGTLELVFGGTLSTSVIIAIAGGIGGSAVGVGAALRRPLPSRPHRRRLTTAERFAVLPALATALSLVQFYNTARFSPLTDSAAWSIWAPKAKAIFYFGGLDEHLFRTIGGGSYPIFVPTLDAMGFHFMGSADSTTLSVQYWLLLVGFVLAAAALLRGLAPAPIVWLAMLLVVVNPELDARLLARLGDWPADFFFALAALALARWLHTRERWPLLLYGLFVSALLATEGEGQLLTASLVVGGIAGCGLARRRDWLAVVGVAAAAYAVNVPWRIWWTSRGLTSATPTSGHLDGTLHYHRILPSLKVVVELLFSSSVFTPVAALALAAVVLALFERERATAVLFAATSCVGIVAIAWVTWSNAIPISSHPELNPTRWTGGALVLLAISFTPILLGLALGREPVLETAAGLWSRWRAAAAPVARASSGVARAWAGVPGTARLAATLRGRTGRALPAAGAVFFLVACTLTYYGQLNRTQTGDVVGTVYTAVGLVQKHTIWLDNYLPVIQGHAGARTGELPYMITYGPGGHIVNATPSASSVLALPVVALFSLAGAQASSWGAWMEASMLTAALSAAATVAVVFALLTRLATRRRAALVTATFAWGTLQWEINGQALWSHGGAALALAVALLALVDRRLTLAGVGIAAMVAFRLTTPVMGVFLLPLIGRRLGDWLRFVLGILPFGLALAVYNTVAFGSPVHQGYGTGHLLAFLHLHPATLAQGTLALLVAPGRGLFVYSPVLLFAVVGAVRGWNVPLYRWCAVAAVANLLVIANAAEWWGGQSFGPRKLADSLPLFAVLLVPAVDSVVRTRWMRWFVVLLGLSVFVEVVGAAAHPPSIWFDSNPDVTSYATWWSVTNNEIVYMLTRTIDTAARIAEMVGILAAAIILGFAASRGLSSLRNLRRPALDNAYQ